jgi:hypothetical protein
LLRCEQRTKNIIARAVKDGIIESDNDVIAAAVQELLHRSFVLEWVGPESRLQTAVL